MHKTTQEQPEVHDKELASKFPWYMSDLSDVPEKWPTVECCWLEGLYLDGTMFEWILLVKEQSHDYQDPAFSTTV